MTPIADEKKRHSLAALYRGMSTLELKRRIRSGELAAPAQVAAEAELQSRESGSPPAVAANPAPDQREAKAKLWRAAVGVVCSALLAWLVVPTGMALAYLPLLVLPWVIAPLAKSFPRAGLLLGGGLAALPVVLWGWAWMAGALAWRHGDFKALETLIAWGVLIVATLICWALASMLLLGARHRGSWSGLHRKLAALREKQADAIR